MPRRPAAEQFAVVISWEDDTPVLAVHGEIDISTGDELWAYIDAALAPAPERLVLDLSPTTFIDSVGLNAIVRAYRRLQAGGGQLIVRAPSPNTLRLLEIAGLADLVPIEGVRAR